MNIQKLYEKLLKYKATSPSRAEFIKTSAKRYLSAHSATMPSHRKCTKAAGK